MIDYELFRKSLIMHRTKLGYTQEKYAERTNITWSSLSKIETGAQKPSTATIIRILNAFHMTMHEYLNEQMDEKDLKIKEILASIRVKELEESEKILLLKIYQFINKRKNE